MGFVEGKSIKGGSVKTFRTLDLAIEFYNCGENARVTGPLRDQLLRASASVALNLSEGNAKSSFKEKKRFYQIAYASLKECQTVLKLGKIEDELITPESLAADTDLAKVWSNYP